MNYSNQNRRKLFSLVIVTMMSLTVFMGLTLQNENVRGATYIVDQGGNGNYLTIQSAINDPGVHDGDTIYVWDGVYIENVVVDKSINLIGNGTANTTIDGGSTGDVIHVISNWVNITGFTITNSGIATGDAGIDLNSVQNCYIADNNVSFNYNGIYLYSSTDNTLTKNTALYNDYGFSLYTSSNYNTLTNNIALENMIGIIFSSSSSNNTLTNNTVSSNVWFGIQIQASSNNNTLTNNTVSLNDGYGINIVASSSYNTLIDNNVTCNFWAGLLCSTNNNTLTNNTVSSNYGDGIFLPTSNNNTLTNNTVSSNDNYGIYLDQSNNNTLTNNTLSSNNNFGIYLNSSAHNLLYHNSIINNTNQAYDDGSNNSWDNGYPSGGNYWSDYNGTDIYSGHGQNESGSDGLGDTPYVIDADSQDHYPLMEPWVPPYIIPLIQGWNLISLPRVQFNENISRTLQSINGKWDCVRYYDALNSSWKSYNIYKPESLNDLQYLDHKTGFWINITEPNVNLTVSGLIPTSTSIPLYAGWNLVGYPTMTEKTVSDALWGTSADKVEVFDPLEPYRIREAEATYIMMPGEGYWVHVPVDTVWVVDW